MALLARLCWKKSVRPRRALNPRPPDYMSGALPSELPGPTSLFQPSPVQVTVVLKAKNKIHTIINFSNYGVYLKNMPMSHELYRNYKQSRNYAPISYFYTCTGGTEFGQFMQGLICIIVLL